MSKNPKRRFGDQHVGFWQMWRDVLIASLSKGQFLPALLGMIFVIMVLKMPAEDVSKLVFETYRNILDGYLVGYCVGIFALSAWFIHSRWQRKIIDREMRRIAEERTKLQQRELPGKITSSE